MSEALRVLALVHFVDVVGVHALDDAFLRALRETLGGSLLHVNARTTVPRDINKEVRCHCRIVGGTEERNTRQRTHAAADGTKRCAHNGKPVIVIENADKWMMSRPSIETVQKHILQIMDLAQNGCVIIMGITELRSLEVIPMNVHLFICSRTSVSEDYGVIEPMDDNKDDFRKAIRAKFARGSHPVAVIVSQNRLQHKNDMQVLHKVQNILPKYTENKLEDFKKRYMLIEFTGNQKWEVDRTDPIVSLSSSFDAVLDGKSAIVIVHGAAGSGKTTLFKSVLALPQYSSMRFHETSTLHDFACFSSCISCADCILVKVHHASSSYVQSLLSYMRNNEALVFVLEITHPKNIAWKGLRLLYEEGAKFVRCEVSEQALLKQLEVLASDILSQLCLELLAKHIYMYNMLPGEALKAIEQLQSLEQKGAIDTHMVKRVLESFEISNCYRTGNERAFINLAADRGLSQGECRTGYALHVNTMYQQVLKSHGLTVSLEETLELYQQRFALNE